MSIKLTGATSGSIELDVPAAVSGGDISLTLPNGVGSAGQYLRNSSTAGTLEFGALPSSGKILQVVQSTKTDVDSITGGTFQDLGLSVSITPSSATSKVLVLMYASISSADSAFDMKLRLMRGSTAVLLGDAASSRPRATTNMTFSWSSGSYGAGNAGINFLDSPATTSATTYKLQAMSYSSYSIYINRGATDTDSSGYEARSASSIIAMEVAA